MKKVIYWQATETLDNASHNQLLKKLETLQNIKHSAQISTQKQLFLENQVLLYFANIVPQCKQHT